MVLMCIFILLLRSVGRENVCLRAASTAEQRTKLVPVSKLPNSAHTSLACSIFIRDVS